jgi:hypothetical protein
LQSLESGDWRVGRVLWTRRHRVDEGAGSRYDDDARKENPT